ncbi:NAD(P)-binding protein [Russula brevipes]|nr:NAD(P)-binding protein [Russula brevipes]
MKRIGILSQLVPPKPHWTAGDVPDQAGRTALITGGDSGIGKETARALLSKGANVYITSNSAARARSTVDELKRETEKDTIFFLRLDLTDLDSVKAAANEFIGKEQELHMLYNNDPMTAQGMAQGHEFLFETNVLAHFFLTKLLLPVLKATAKNSPPGTVRVINLSSISHYMAPVEARVARGKLGTIRLNGQSKLGTILFSNKLAEVCKSDGIVSISLFPGAPNADIWGRAGASLRRAKQLLFSNASLCASTSLYAGTSPEAGQLSGKYLTAWARVTLPHRKALLPALRESVWTWCETRIEDYHENRTTN